MPRPIYSQKPNYSKQRTKERQTAARASVLNTRRDRKPKNTVTKTPRVHKEIADYQRMLTAPFGQGMGPVMLPSQYKGALVPLMLEASFTPTIRDPADGSELGSGRGDFILQLRPELDTFSNESSSAFQGGVYAVDAAAAHPEYAAHSNLETNAILWRPLCMAAKIEYLGTADARAGEIQYLFQNSLSTTPPSNTYNWQNVHATSGSKALNSHKEVTLVSRLFDNPDFVNMAGSGNNKMQTICIAGKGVPYGQTIKITTRFFIEVVPSIASTLADSARQSHQHTGYVNAVPNDTVSSS